MPIDACWPAGDFVAHDHLGLFDTPADRQEIRVGLAIVGLLFATLLFILPVADIPVRAVEAFVPTIDAVMFAGELIIGTLLYAQAAVFRSRALTVLASGYVFIALVLVPHALTFPGAFAPQGLLGAGINTTAWLAISRRLAFPIAIIVYALLKSADSAARAEAARPRARVLEGVLGAVLLAALATLLTTAGHDFLPPFFLNEREAIHTNLIIMNSVTIGLTIVAIAMLFWRDRSVLDMWLLVALSGWLFQSVLNLPLHTRFTLGWYGLFGMMLASNLIVMLALIAESNRLYARLALLTAAREREREARLMSMDAVAAAIAHEVGQPLTAIRLNASAGLSLLTRAQPKPEKAIAAFRFVSDSAQRSFDILKNIRSIFVKGPEWAIEFSLNDLVRETAALLDRELAGAKVSLQLSLDEALPPVLANRVQMQQVLVNLVTNAIEALIATRGRARRITIRSISVDDGTVLLEISDSGVGIAPDEAQRVFEAFYTTKATGTGIGLSLCRTIVDEHGGRIWVSSGEKYGATFHVQLPHSRFSQTVLASSQ